MGLCELAVTPARQSQGIGSRLHTELLKAITPDYASLLVRPDNTAGRTLYDRLGYTYAGPYRNELDTTGVPTAAAGGRRRTPVYDLLLLHVDSEAAAR
ncbi:GNAT family N-acetyltransferase [Streptomyces bobili]|uniref:GNAT family N-acetyltransferase n=1 Tax=Streptomyces bobili TaxID=67280 RepID=UPI0033A9352C